jgi:lipopolysaccharide transport system ATP-binding protein
MSESVITVDGLSKSYMISHERRDPYTSLGETMTKGIKSIFSATKASAQTVEEFWALNDVSFEVKRGERIGIIGRNGAGKSTLLKILSRITEPTRGTVTLDGRVASLLEVGTGFHPELTGKENIFLNGAILGMSRREIRKKFDEIVAFAEVEKFLDTPVKRYSSGMYVRLAFSVAAHLEPEILIVDEVLAVGDAQFQKKCLGKMEDVSTNEGRTVLFVSHNMSTLKSLCSSIIYLAGGKVISQGGVEPTIRTYLEENRTNSDSGLIPADYPRKYKTGEAFFVVAMTSDLAGEQRKEFSFGETFCVNIEIDVIKPVENALVNVLICTTTGEGIALIAESNDGVYRPRDFAPGRHKARIAVNSKLLPSAYTLTAFLAYYGNGTPIDWVENVSSFRVSNVGLKKGSDYPWGPVHGSIEPESSWDYQGLQ